MRSYIPFTKDFGACYNCNDIIQKRLMAKEVK